MLLDTHALLWWLAGGESLSKEARVAIASPENTVGVSSATTWEISIKQALGKLEAPNDLEQQIHANEFAELAITVRDGLAAGRLPRHHEDPFDRMLIAQAQVRSLTIVTRDPRFSAYDVEVFPA